MGMNTNWSRRSFIQGAGAASLAHWFPVNSLPSAQIRVNPVPVVAFRIQVAQWKSKRRFESLLRFFRKYPTTADELAFFTSDTHAPLPLAEMEKRAELLKFRLDSAHREGITAGINVLTTLGHHEENLPYSLQAPWQRLMDPQGNICRGSFCPSHTEILAYDRKIYTAIAQANPDFIWVDDDVRLEGHMPIRFTCFCDLCVSNFSRQVGLQFTRHTLVAAFDTGPLEQRLRLRREWLNHNRGLIHNVLRNVAGAVYKVKPEITLGFMTGDRFYEGYDFKSWAKALGGPDCRPVRWRPGGGFYTDECLVGLAEKAHDIGRQVSQLPKSLKVIECEIENFPYQLLRKSATATVNEAAAHMGAGSTGAAFNVLSQRPDPLEEYGAMLRRIHQAKGFYQSIQKKLGRAIPVGIWPAWNQDIFSVNNLEGSWLDGNEDIIPLLKKTYVLGEIGIPVCYGPQGAVATVLAGPSLFAFRRDDLQRIFSKGVLMDVPAWEALDKLGLAGWTGVRVRSKYNHDTIEIFTEHPLNGRFANWSRDCRQSFWPEVVYSFESQSSGVVELSRLVDYAGNDRGCGLSAYENELGGRVVVAGYYPWSQIHNLAKSSQVKALCSWISHDHVPVCLESFARVHIWVRQDALGNLACVLLNASLDTQESVRLSCGNPYKRFTWLNMNGQSSSLESETPSGVHKSYVRTPRLDAWGIYMLSAVL